MTPLPLEIRYPWIGPVAIDLPGPIDVRWYGLMYLLGFVVAYFVLRWLARERFLCLVPEGVGTLLTALVLGVMLGGRIGYILFYNLPTSLADPARILRVWEGGMSFHGGLLGVILAAAWFARRHRTSYLNLGDGLALAVPFGIFAVRVANWVNGELYGRIAGRGVPWAMRFPTDPVALRLLGAEALPLRARELAIAQAYRSGLWEQIAPLVPLRHPSQLYEALLEGVLLGLMLWALFAWTRRWGARLPSGTYAGAFLIGYGVMRFFVERFRQPDVQFRGPGNPLGTVLGPLTMGQVLSTLMLLGGLGLLAWSWRRGSHSPPRGDRGTRDGHGCRRGVERDRRLAPPGPDSDAGDDRSRAAGADARAPRADRAAD